MICYKDRAYCSWSQSCITDCTRRLTTKEKEVAASRGLPIAYCDFRQSEQCPGYATTTLDVEESSETDRH